jgi:hypothetical protein
MNFSNEIRDFIGAWQAGTKILGAADDAEYKRARTKHLGAQTKDLEDPERIKLERDGMRARNAASSESAASSRATRARLNDPEDIRLSRAVKQGAIDAANQRTNYYRARTDLLTNPLPAPTVGSPITPQTAPPDTSAIPTYGDDVEAGVRTPMMSKGGLVQKFEDGGPVDEPDVDDDDADDLPAARPAIGGVTDTDMSSQGKPSFSHDAARDAINAGIKHNVQQFGLDQKAAVPTAARQQGLQGYVRGANAAPPADMDAIRKAVDPKGQMSESERNLAAFGALWQFKQNQGDAKGAEAAAGQMLSHYRQAATRYAALASVAANEGRIDEAARFAMKSYANVPDGKDIQISKTKDGRLQYSFIDERTGKTVSKGIATPQELAGAVHGIATDKFDELILRASGEYSDTSRGKKGAVGGDGMKPRDRETVEKGVEGAWQKFTGERGEDAPKIPDQERGELVGLANRIYRGNDGMTADEALRTTMRLALPNPKDPNTKDFSLKPVEGGGAQIAFQNGARLTLDPESLDRLMFMRNAKAKKLNEEIEKAKQPGFLGKASDAIGGAVTKAYRGAFGG